MSFTIACIDVIGIKTKDDPVYRVFVNDQLVVERAFWPDAPDYFIREQLTFFDNEQTYRIKVKNVFEDRGSIRVGNIKFIDGDTNELVDITAKKQNDVYTFTLPKR